MLTSMAQVEFKVNGVKQDYAMKLGEEGEAFFVFGTSSDVPTDLQTSPVVSPATSPASTAAEKASGEAVFQEPDFLDLGGSGSATRRPSAASMQARSVTYMGSLRAPSGPGITNGSDLVHMLIGRPRRHHPHIRLSA